MLPFPSSPSGRLSTSSSHLHERAMSSDGETDPLSNRSSEIEAEMFLDFEPISNAPPDQAVETETLAYHSLVNEGGRPSHPLGMLQSIVSAPGKYRDILAFWQDQSDEWQVFSKQLTRWRMFMSHQRSSRHSIRYPNHLEELTERLERHSFALPPAFDKPPNGFCKHIERQNKLATWIEYINYEFTRRDEYDKWLETCQPGYDAALAQLMDAQVLGPFEQVRTPTSDICRPSSLEVTRRRDERRRAEEACETAKKRLNWRDPLGGPQTSQQMERDQRLYTEARERLRLINKRGYVISDFARKTHAYRFAQDRSERHELLLRWALDQVPLIEEELRKDDQLALAAEIQGAPPIQEPVVEPYFLFFQQLPPEIRHRIWCELMPRTPSVHFFEVLNHQRRRHLAPSWSTEEFRVRATTARNSGYLSVYTLLATCRESRRLVETYYICRRRGVKCPLSGGTIRLSDNPPDFRTFDWIPHDDLIVLSFPPTQVARLPAGNAFTLSPGPEQAARNIGICVPTEIMSQNHFSPTDEGEGDDDAAQISLIPEFINRLHRPIHPDQQTNTVSRGIWKLYLIVEGWTTNHMAMQVTVGVDTNTPVDKWSDNYICWISQSARKEERTQLWKYIMGAKPDDDPFPEEESKKRQLWWLGSGDSALSSLCPDDRVQKAPAKRLREFMETLAAKVDLQPWHKGFEGVEALGWLEPAGMDVLEANPWDLVEIIRNRGGCPPAHWKGRGQSSN
ncbi:hypothetical protein V8C42DRAFT_310910 [Trichoderma barbatum]